MAGARSPKHRHAGGGRHPRQFPQPLRSMRISHAHRDRARLAHVSLAEACVGPGLRRDDDIGKLHGRPHRSVRSPHRGVCAPTYPRAPGLAHNPLVRPRGDVSGGVLKRGWMQSRRCGTAGGNVCRDAGRGADAPLSPPAHAAGTWRSNADRRFKSAPRERKSHNRRR